MAHNISKYGGFGTPVRGAIEDTYTQAVADAATAAVAADTVLGTAVKGVNWTSGMTLKAHDDAIAAKDLYPLITVGGNTTAAAVFTAIGNKPTNRTPAVGDEIVMITGVVTASGVPVASPAIVAADTSDGVVKLLALDGATAKVKWGKDSGADLSANTYTCWVKPA